MKDVATSNVVRPKEFRSRRPERGVCACGWRQPKNLGVTCRGGCEVTFRCPQCGVRTVITTVEAPEGWKP